MTMVSDCCTKKQGNQVASNGDTIKTASLEKYVFGLAMRARARMLYICGENTHQPARV